MLYVMKVWVRLFAGFRDGRFKEKGLEFPSGMSVRQVVESLGIDPDEVGVTMINSRHCSLNDVLSDQDVLAVFPMIGGG